MKSHHLFDDLIGAGKQGGRNFETEGLGGSQIDNQFEFGRPLDR
jgi:hypothetical protein